jgi:hypothetical protein
MGSDGVGCPYCIYVCTRFDITDEEGLRQGSRARSQSHRHDAVQLQPIYPILNSSMPLILQNHVLLSNGTIISIFQTFDSMNRQFLIPSINSRTNIVPAPIPATRYLAHRPSRPFCVALWSVTHADYPLDLESAWWFDDLIPQKLLMPLPCRVWGRKEGLRGENGAVGWRIEGVRLWRT